MSNYYQEARITSGCQVEIHRDSSRVADTIPLHSHSFYEIIFVCGGNLQYLLEGRRYRIQKGDILLIPPGLSHRPLFLEELTEPYERLALWIDARFWQDMCAKYPDLNYAFDCCVKQDNCLLRTPSATWSGLYAGFQGVYHEFEEKKMNWELCLTASALSLMAHICRTYYYQGGACPVSEKEQLLDNIFSYINHHYQEPLSLDFISEHFLVSKSTVSHLFQQKLGVSFYHCVIQRRLIGAKNSILQGARIQDVWEPYGFADYTSFYRAFKREYGLSPREFQKQNRPPAPSSNR